LYIAFLYKKNYNSRNKEPPMRVAVTTFPGSNCDDDALRAVSLFGATPVRVWHKDALPGVDAVIIPGGFSYGDYLRCGAMAARSRVMEDVRAFAARGGPVLGICNGFQILCEAGLLPGALVRNLGRRFVCRGVTLQVEGQETPFTRSLLGKTLALPVAHAEGRFIAEDDTLKELEQEGRVIFRYVNGSNPNGALRDIAGVASANRNVVGLMPHPERATEELLGSRDGALLFSSFLS
jgi:phosphoribosylformylglycinamidine synthase subunit PurQ / glutaminase